MNYIHGRIYNEKYGYFAFDGDLNSAFISATTSKYKNPYILLNMKQQYTIYGVIVVRRPEILSKHS